jgi:hypothetical protein
MIYGIYDCTNWDDNVITISIQETNNVNGNLFPVSKNTKKYKVKVTDEDNKELCREQIREFVKTLNIEVYNIDKKFSIK